MKRKQKKTVSKGEDANLPQKKARGPRVRFWFFTDNGKAGSLGKQLVANPEVWKELPVGVTYLTWQLEEGDETHHPHLQGHLHLQRNQYVSWVHKNVSKTARFEERWGTSQQCDVYCHKEEGRLAGPYTLGEPVGRQMGKADLGDVIRRCKEGVTWREFYEDDPAMTHRYERLIRKVKTIYAPRYEPDGQGATVALLYGVAGCGKTAAAFAQWSDGDFYELPLTGSSSIWWDGLDRHNKILMDDFTGAASHMRLDVLLKILDRYPRRVPIKGSFEWLVGDKNVIITSNMHPRKWYNWQGREEQWPALKRRIHEVYIWKEKECVRADDTFWDFEEDFVFYEEVLSFGSVKRNMYPMFKQ